MNADVFACIQMPAMTQASEVHMTSNDARSHARPLMRTIGHTWVHCHVPCVLCLYAQSV